jgi:hypothetical protein
VQAELPVIGELGEREQVLVSAWLTGAPDWAVRHCLVAEPRVFDEQLAMLEGILGPLAEWSTAWAEFEGLGMNARRDPGA